MEGPIDDLLSISPTPGTRRVYRSALRAFPGFVDGRERPGRETGVRPEAVDYEALAAQYLATGRDQAADLIRFAGSSSDAPTTTQNRAAIVLEFLAHHGIDLSDRDRRQVRQKLPRGGVVTRRGDVTHEMLLRVAGHLDERGRALLLVLASSGMRIGEAVAIRLRELDLRATPATSRWARGAAPSGEATAARDGAVIRPAPPESSRGGDGGRRTTRSILPSDRKRATCPRSGSARGQTSAGSPDSRSR